MTAQITHYYYYYYFQSLMSRMTWITAQMNLPVRTLSFFMTILHVCRNNQCYEEFNYEWMDYNLMSVYL